MIRYTLLFSSICSLFVLSWILSRWTSQANCINSSMVSKVVIYPDGDELPTCDLEARLFHLKLADFFKRERLIRRIEKLEKIVPLIWLKDDPLIVKVFQSQKNILIFNEGQILISSDMISKAGILERAILTQQLESTTPFTSSILVDFIWAELLMKTELPPNHATWISQIRSLHGYCQSQDTLLLHHDFCQTHNALNDGMIISEGDEAVVWSLHALYLQILRRVYQSANWLEKKSILENFTLLGEIDESFISNIRNWRDPLAAEQSLIQHVRDWLLPVIDNEKLIFTALSPHLLQMQKFQFHVVGRSSRNYYPLYEVISKPDYQNMLDEIISGDRAQTIVQYGRKVRFYPSEIWHDFHYTTLFHKLSVEQFVYVSCQLPEVQTLTGYSHVVDKIIHIRQCSNEELNWAQLHMRTVQSFLQSELKTFFIEFNLADLQFAEKIRGPLREHERFSAWQRWLLWQKTTGEEEFQIRRPVAAIDGVGRYRYQ